MGRRFLGAGTGHGWRKCSGGRRRIGLLAVADIEREGLAMVGFWRHADVEEGGGVGGGVHHRSIFGAGLDGRGRPS